VIFSLIKIIKELLLHQKDQFKKNKLELIKNKLKFNKNKMLNKLNHKMLLSNNRMLLMISKIKSIGFKIRFNNFQLLKIKKIKKKMNLYLNLLLLHNNLPSLYKIFNLLNQYKVLQLQLKNKIKNY
jgi:hypothetical protein